VADAIASITNLTKRYGDFEAVSAVDLEVLEGEIFSLLGPNGAGKTTTIRMLMGILRPTAGTATVRGLDCFADRAEVKRFVGYQPDEPIFYDYLTGREILFFVGEMHGFKRSRIEDLYSPLVERLDLAEALGEYAINYSHGMKKKLALVCAFIHDPDFLILDEPTNGLDPYATRTVHELLRETIAAGKSVFFSTHLLDQAEKLSHRVGILNRGKLAAVGKLDELRDGLEKDSSLEEIFFSATGQSRQDENEAPR